LTTGGWEWDGIHRQRVNEAGVRALFRGFEQSLSGWPDTILSVALVGSGIAVIFVGLFAPRAIKLLILAWIWFP
jgi:hypothetical protein